MKNLFIIMLFSLLSYNAVCQTNVEVIVKEELSFIIEIHEKIVEVEEELELLSLQETKTFYEPIFIAPKGEYIIAPYEEEYKEYYR